MTQQTQETRTAGYRWFHRFAVLSALATYVVLIAGASVTSTGSGLAVPDWPLSYGELFPPMVGGVLFEHGHRMIAGAVALMLFVLAFWAWKVERRGWVQYLTGLGVTLIVVQALLGGITVLMLLPASVSVAHAGLAMLLFGAVLIIAAVTSSGWRDTGSATSEAAAASARKLGGFSLLVTALVFGQILIGAVMRHIGAGLACPDFPLCHGELVPPLDSLYMASHFYHRTGAYLVTVAVWGLFFAARSWVPGASGARRLATLAALVVVVQFVLGVASVLTKLSPPVTVLHHAGGAALFGLLTLLTLWAFRLGHRREVRAPEVGHQLAGSPAA
jgi:cytochrome c oxidase assembly protein subunit 15